MMKKFLSVFGFICIIAFLSGCSDTTEDPKVSEFFSEDTPSEATIDQTDTPAEVDTTLSTETAQSLNNSAADDFFQQANQKASSNQHEDALELYDKALDLVDGASAVKVLGNKAATLYHLERYDEAMTLYDDMLMIDEKNADAYSNKGAAYSKQGEYEKAIEMYNKALSIEPTNFPAFYNKACAHALLGNKTDALEHLSRAFKLNAEAKPFAQKDEDLKSLWDDPEFLKLIE